jgi:cell division septation protein DedD
VIIDQQNVQNQQNQQQPNNQNTQPSAGAGNNTGTAQTVESTKGPYSVQFGSFSTKSGADEMSTALTGKGIYSYVYESNGSYKVLGLPYESEAKAKEAAAVVSAVVSDVFVVNLSSLIQ